MVGVQVCDKKLLNRSWGDSAPRSSLSSPSSGLFLQNENPGSMRQIRRCLTYKSCVGETRINGLMLVKLWRYMLEQSRSTLQRNLTYSLCNGLETHQIYISGIRRDLKKLWDEGIRHFCCPDRCSGVRGGGEQLLRVSQEWIKTTHQARLLCEGTMLKIQPQCLDTCSWFLYERKWGESQGRNQCSRGARWCDSFAASWHFDSRTASASQSEFNSN